MEIINAVDMKRKTKAQFYRDYKYNIKMFAWNALYPLERQRSHDNTIHRPTGPINFIGKRNRGKN